MKYRLGHLTLDEDTRELRSDGKTIHLSRKAFDLLAALVHARPRALSKTELHALLWPDTFVSDANLAMLVAEVRGALNDDARSPRFVRTVQRFGYAFHGDATEVADARVAESGSAVSKYWLIAPLRQIPLLAGENLVGRDPGVQVWLDSAGVSRRHARITVDGESATLEDLQSKNGTRVGGHQITTAVPLSDGVDIRFGSVLVKFRRFSGEPTETESDQ